MNEIINMDCFVYLKDIQDKHFDLLLIDPPYNLFKNKETTIRGSKPFGKISIGGNNIAKVKEYPPIDWDVELTKEQIKELFRVSKNQIIFGFEHLSDKLPKSRGIYCWDKKRGEGTTFSDFELIWTSYDQPSTFIRFKWNGMLKDNWEVEKNIRVHPTQKPIEIIKILLEKHSLEGENVLDCFLGSGTTAVACKQLNRKFVGVEISSKYCDIARKRLEQENLFKYASKQGDTS